VLPDAGVLTWGEVTQYRFMTLSSEQMLTDSLTASRTVVARLSRFCENAFTNFADQDQAALSISDPAISYQITFLWSNAFQATSAQNRFTSIPVPHQLHHHARMTPVSCLISRTVLLHLKGVQLQPLNLDGSPHGESNSSSVSGREKIPTHPGDPCPFQGRPDRSRCLVTSRSLLGQARH
jgi:hypothetical protein